MARPAARPAADPGAITGPEAAPDRAARATRAAALIALAACGPGVHAQPEATRPAQSTARPSPGAPALAPSRETLREFLDSVVEGVLTRDRDAVYTRNGAERIVSLRGGVEAHFSRSVALATDVDTGRVPMAGSHATTLGLRRETPGSTLRLRRIDQGTASDREAAIGLKSASGQLAELRMLRSVAQDRDRHDESLTLHQPLGAGFAAHLGISRIALDDDALGRLDEGRAAGALLSWHGAGTTQAGLGWQRRLDQDGSAYKLIGRTAVGARTDVYASHEGGSDLLLRGAMRPAEAWRTRVGLSHRLAPQGSADSQVYAEWRGGSLIDSRDQVAALGWQDSWPLDGRWRLRTLVEGSARLNGTLAANGLRTGAGLRREFDGDSSFDTWMENAVADTGDSQYAEIKYTVRASERAVLATRLSHSLRLPAK